MTVSYQIRPGGLMRCCIATVEEVMDATEVPPKPGDTIQCKHHDNHGGMIFRGGAWEWNKPESLEW